jgi:hypothetical protein
VFTARYALSPYIKQIYFVFKGLNSNGFDVVLSVRGSNVDRNTGCSVANFLFFLPEDGECFLVAWRQTEPVSCAFVRVSSLHEAGSTPPPPRSLMCTANGINGVRFISVIKMLYQVPLKASCSHRKYVVMNGVLYPSITLQLKWIGHHNFKFLCFFLNCVM